MSKLVNNNSSIPELKLIQDKLEICCYHCGSYNYWKNGSNGNRKKYQCKNCKRYFLEGQKNKSKYASGLPIGDDVWDVSKLGTRVNQHRKETKILFIYVQQKWLKDYAKKFIKYKAINSQHRTLQDYMTTLNMFSRFIAAYPINVTEQDINRSLIVDFLCFTEFQKLAATTKNKRLSNLKLFFETGVMNKWFEIEPYVIRPEDFARKEKTLPRYIPENIMRQLNQNLSFLPEPVMRMVLVIQETGLRVSELLQLKADCLLQDAKGDWFIKHTNWKMNKEDTKPISVELARVIQEQQSFIKQYFNTSFDYLFCTRKKGNTGNKFVPEQKIMYYKSFINYIKKLAKEKNICDSSGKVWNFQSHQFRHTVGTRMINNGVPQHIIQRYLGHETPAMTSVYAHIHDKTLKQEIAKYHDSRVVNVAGEVVKSTTPELDNDLDLHLLKKKVLAQSLPNGSCARPIVLGECPHANACFTCGDFRTTIEFLDQHKTQLEETAKLVKNAEENGWKRHAEMNTKVRDNLQKIITTLESGNKDIVSGGDE